MSDVKDGSDALGDEPRQHQTRTCAYIRGFNGCAGQAFTTSNQSVMTISTDVRPSWCNSCTKRERASNKFT